MKKNILNKSKVKEIFAERGFKIGNNTILKFSEFIQEFAENLAERVIRQAKISGRKIIKNEDIDAS